MSIKDSGIFKLKKNPSGASRALALAGIILLLSFGMGFAPPEPIPTPEPVSIMPLGDSITDGALFTHTYRYYLWRMLVEADANFDFVGSRKSYDNGRSSRPPYDGLEFDGDHEGHWAWPLEAILKGHYTRQGKLSEWLKERVPDVVLLHLGTNDIGESRSIPDIMENLEEIIEALRVGNPGVTILFAKVIPVNDEKQSSPILDLNNSIGALALEISTDASPIIVVNQFDGFDANTDTYDGVHPNRRGAQKMAERWFETLKPVVDKKAKEHAAGT